MKKIILSIALVLACAMGVLIPALNRNKASASSDKFYVTADFATLTKEEITSSDKYRLIADGDNLSNATVYICANESYGFNLKSEEGRGLYVIPLQCTFGTLKGDEVYNANSFLTSGNAPFPSNYSQDERALAMTIYGDFSNIELVSSADKVYIEIIEDNEDNAESEAESESESKEMFFDKANKWTNETLGLSLSTSAFGTILLVLALILVFKRK